MNEIFSSDLNLKWIGKTFKAFLCDKALSLTSIKNPLHARKLLFLAKNFDFFHFQKELQAYKGIRFKVFLFYSF